MHRSMLVEQYKQQHGRPNGLLKSWNAPHTTCTHSTAVESTSMSESLCTSLATCSSQQQTASIQQLLLLLLLLPPSSMAPVQM